MRSMRLVRLVLALVKGSALGGLLTLAVAGGVHTGPTAEGPGGTTGVPSQRVVERAVEGHHCSPTGFDDRRPASALVRTADGRLRQVSFDVGWEVFNHERPGTLVAVCLDEPAETQVGHEMPERRNSRGGA
jgi:hypothetical protein